jgi:hypothetical protein
MDMDFLSPAATVESLKDAGESTMHASLSHDPNTGMVHLYDG